MREKTAQQIYEEFKAEGEFRPSEINLEEINKIKNIALEDAKYIEFLLKQEKINWRVIYTISYDVMRSLCESLARLKGLKISNHQGCFAYTCIEFPELELDWSFFEKIRTTRNRIKYEGTDINKENWKQIELQIDIYTKTIKKKIEELSKN